MTQLTIQNLSFKRQQKDILSGVNLEITHHSIYGLLGQNGAGKSTLIKLILGILAPSDGTILFDNEPLDDESRISFLQKIGSLIENASLYSHLTVFENIELARRIYGVEKTYTHELLKIVGLTSATKSKVATLSLGMKQRAGIALAMIGKPEMVILDEPMNGLDPDGLKDLRNLITKLNAELGTTFLISSHQLAEIEKVVTHVGILQNGKMAYHGSAPSHITLEELYFEKTR